MSRKLAAMIAPLMMSLSGCWGAPAPKFPETVPFTGVVTLDGQPLDFATVVFTPTAQGTTAMGSTDAEGNYSLFVAFGSARKEGVVPGDYKVHISTLMPPPPEPGQKLDRDAPAMQEERVPQKYNNFQQTTLKVKVPSEGGSMDFDLKSK